MIGHSVKYTEKIIRENAKKKPDLKINLTPKLVLTCLQI